MEKRALCGAGLAGLHSSATFYERLNRCRNLVVFGGGVLYKILE